MYLSLVNALKLPEQGIISLIGGGGKTSLLYKLGKELSFLGKRVVVTTSTHIFAPKQNQAGLLLIDPQPETLKTAWKSTNLICVGGKSENLKLNAPGNNFFEWCMDYANYVIVEADGARCCPFKAPKEGEPAIPLATNIVIGVAGIKAINYPISQVCHRPELVCEILGTSKDEPLTPKRMAEVIISTKGYLKGVEEKNNFRLVINQCDTEKEIALGKQVASELKEQGFSVLITALEDNNPVKWLF